MSYFIWNDVSSEEFGILESLPLNLRAERITQIIDIPNGMPIVYESKAFRSMQQVLNIGLRDTSDDNIMAMNRWLTGTGKLIFSNDPTRYYNAVCFGSLTGERMVKQLGRMSVNFTVLPLRYALDNEWEDVTFANNEGWIHYDGTYEGEPTLKIHASGDIDIQWASYGIKVRNVSDYCVIDIPTRRVYDSHGNVILNETIGPIMNMVLRPGYYEKNTSTGKMELKSAATFIKLNSGNIQSVQIKKNRRWL